MGEGSISILPTRKDKTRETCDEQNGERAREKRKTKKSTQTLAGFFPSFFPFLFWKMKKLDEMIIREIHHI
jgi:hypothetical protein